MTENLIGLHGLGGDSTAWASLDRDAGGGLHVEGIDLPGFGSAAPLGRRDVAAMRDHVIDALSGRARFWLMGQSMGAKIALAVARAAQDGDARLAGLQGLVLLAGSPPAPEPIDAQAREDMLGWFRGHPDDSRAQAEQFVDANSAGPLPEAERAAAVAAVLRSHPEAWWAWLAAGLEEDWRERIGRLDVPALVVAGDEDGALGPQAQAEHMLPHLPNARFVVLRGAAHLLHLERSAVLAQVIGAWMAEFEAAPIAMPADRRDFRALIDGVRVSAGTRAVLQARVQAEPPPAPEAMAACLEAVAGWCLPGVAAEGLVRAAVAACEGGGDGWRFAILPPDAQAWREGVAALDRRAGGALAGLDARARDRLLDEIASGDVAVSREAAFVADVQAALARLHVARPQQMAEMGYDGPAYGGDTPRLPGFAPVGIGVVEPWEPPAGSVWR
ncbi:pimeloyl-ACP methyl ester carboxylesterase [Endobacter medicaginis]|uniref:Pimeloyl-ACP methyl ester carboxylesterase n=1 Tax=Endobacter medicaginis TaxID=1181271 RepID=A0A839V295_9PROT|nr:alpha/beta fold hydrolase [Endobacter medicaginis]MBB3173621.1 pimeloyl-ACP methyl ester carboxylesterase [Endobacter medicaginis]MCX5477045.1 alpha/beta fold hydrolase [Endobacter medicaginis]